jgi:hypothetical protein
VPGAGVFHQEGSNGALTGQQQDIRQGAIVASPRSQVILGDAGSGSRNAMKIRGSSKGSYLLESAFAEPAQEITYRKVLVMDVAAFA